MSYIGTTISAVAGAPSTDDQSGFEALSWSAEIGNVISSSEMGDTHADQSETRLKTGRTVHTNGAKDGGEINVAIDGEDYTDAGLAIIKTANGTNNTVSLRFANSSRTRYVHGVIRNFKTKSMDATTKAGVSFTVAVNCEVVDLASS